MAELNFENSCAVYLWKLIFVVISFHKNSNLIAEQNYSFLKKKQLFNVGVFCHAALQDSEVRQLIALFYFLLSLTYQREI